MESRCSAALYTGKEVVGSWTMPVHGLSLQLPIRDGGSDAVDKLASSLSLFWRGNRDVRGRSDCGKASLAMVSEIASAVFGSTLLIAGIRWDYVQVSGGLVFIHSLHMARLQGCGLPCFVLIAFRALTVRSSSKPTLYHISGSERLIVNKSWRPGLSAWDERGVCIASNFLDISIVCQVVNYLHLRGIKF